MAKRPAQPDEPPDAGKPVIAVTMGDPAGIGPEVVVKALADPVLRRRARFVVFGMNELLAYAADLAEIEPFWFRLQHDSPRAAYALTHDVVVLDYDEYSMLGSAFHQPTKQGGQASIRFIEDAIAASLKPTYAEGRVDAVVTAPISKTSWKLAGFRRFPGHTELFAHRTKARRHAMLFHAPSIALPGVAASAAHASAPNDPNPPAAPPRSRSLNVVLATIHLPLMDIRNVLTIGKVYDPIDLGNQALIDLGVEKPRIAVCGLNPHAGEEGLFGDEEQRLITPAIEMARQHGIDAHGPFPADTLFTPRNLTRYDLFVAMYHDQGLIPIKMLAFDSAVNMTLGLPVIRTSPDHGTAFDIVGQNLADPGSMKSALHLAIDSAAAAKRADR
ncbi:MAG: 4-hydroxythreonine-4-phosphate dehydrogenase PdxA [Phycisphaeraceae bacterium]